MNEDLCKSCGANVGLATLSTIGCPVCGKN